MGLVVLAVAALRRRRSLVPTWGWNDVAVTLFVGGRLTEVSLAEVRALWVGGGAVAFETAGGQVAVEARWVTAPLFGARVTLSGLDEPALRTAMVAPTPMRVWRGAPGTLRFPSFPSGPTV
ncbi:MAG: hypothetical protein SFW67_25255 [Myxococcaceae bacterium]|nr:hypothetical protein [Myxococcaceae bacterium]